MCKYIFKVLHAKFVYVQGRVQNPKTHFVDVANYWKQWKHYFEWVENGCFSYYYPKPLETKCTEFETIV